MEPMVMRFNVRDGDLLRRIELGQQVYFRLSVDRRSSHIDHIVVTSAPPVEPLNWQYAEGIGLNSALIQL